jgi:hypothetical protein
MTHFSVRQWIRLAILRIPGEKINKYLLNEALYFSVPSNTACCTGRRGYAWAMNSSLYPERLPTCPECAMHYDQALLLRDHP